MRGSRYDRYTIYTKYAAVSFPWDATEDLERTTKSNQWPSRTKCTSCDRLPRDQIWEMWSFPTPKARQRTYEEGLSSYVRMRPHGMASDHRPMYWYKHTG